MPLRKCGAFRPRASWAEKWAENSPAFPKPTSSPVVFLWQGELVSTVNRPVKRKREPLRLP
jgi:hypothetical protein